MAYSYKGMSRAGHVSRISRTTSQGTMLMRAPPVRIWRVPHITFHPFRALLNRDPIRHTDALQLLPQAPPPVPSSQFLVESQNAQRDMQGKSCKANRHVEDYFVCSFCTSLTKHIIEALEHIGQDTTRTLDNPVPAIVILLIHLIQESILFLSPIVPIPSKVLVTYAHRVVFVIPHYSFLKSVIAAIAICA
jgi:hypothetical protein